MDGLMLGRAWWPQMAPGINRKYSAKKCKEPLTLPNLLGAPKEKLYQESWPGVPLYLISPPRILPGKVVGWGVLLNPQVEVDD